MVESEPVRWRSIIIPAYGPTFLVSIGQGAVLPLIALSARDLGGSIGTAAFIVALAGIGQLIGDLPAGALAARIGEQRALVGACLFDVVALVGAFLAPNLLTLGLAITAMGMAAAVFSLARQAYLTESIPIQVRARAMSSLGGTFRIGLFIGPFVAAVLVTHYSIGTAYAFAALMSLAAAILTSFLPDVTAGQRSDRREAGEAHRSVVSVLRQHRHVLLTMGVGVTMISAARATRQSIIPLWAESVGLSPATTAIIYGLSAGVDMLLFFPGGAIMDRYGRRYVAIPAMIVLGLGFVMLPLTDTATSVGLVAALMGLGNGISAGVVMTLGADAAPPAERPQFLAGWRLCSDVGNAGGPLLVAAISLLAPLALASVVMAALTWGSAGWLARWVPGRRVR